MRLWSQHVGIRINWISPGPDTSENLVPSSEAYNAFIQKTILAMAIVAILVGSFFRGYHLDSKTFWGDEIVGLVHMLGYTEAEIVRAGPNVRTASDIQAYFHLSGPGNEGPRPLIATVRSLATEDPQHPPVYYLMGRLWASWAGLGPAALRTLPFIFGLLSIGAMAWLAFELFHSARAALIAASLYAISPFEVLYSQEAREITLWSLETLVSSALLLRAARSGRTGPWIMYGLTSAVSLYTYPLAAFVMVAHCGAVLISPALRNREVLLRYCLASAAATLPFLPWLFIIITSESGAKGFGALLANKPSALGVVLIFMRDIKATMVDVGMVAPGTAARLTLSVAGTAILLTTLYSVARLTWVSPRETANRFILALFAIPAVPLLLMHGGALAGQIRYLQPTYLATQLALTAFLHATLANQRASRPRSFACAAAYSLIVALSALSCFISADADTWYHKAYERTPQVAAIINQTDRPLVIGDLAVVNDRGTSRVLELGYYLKPDVAMRVNLHCEMCLIPPPAPIDVFADAEQFSNVFVLGMLKRTIPAGHYAVRQLGIDIDPVKRGPLEMFTQYPR
jgi:uncharacterized membrane protein